MLFFPRLKKVLRRSLVHPVEFRIDPQTRVYSEKNSSGTGQKSLALVNEQLFFSHVKTIHQKSVQVSLPIEFVQKKIDDNGLDPL